MMKQNSLLSYRISGYFAGLCTLLLALTGCIEVDYVGQTFPELPADSEVTFFDDKSTLPENTYRPIGRINLTAPDGTDMEEIKLELLQKARQEGGNAVKIEDLQRIVIGSVATSDLAMDGPNSAWNADGLNPDGSYIYTDSFGSAQSLSSGAKELYEIRVKALVLVRQSRFEEVVDTWRKEHAAKLAEEAHVERAETLEATPAEEPVDTEPEISVETAPDSESFDEAIGLTPGVIPDTAPEMPRESKATDDATPTQLQLREEPISL